MGWTVYNSDGQILQGSSTLADDAVTTAKILDANVTLAKMANNSVDSDQYVDGSIDNVHIATGLDAVKLADGSVTNAELQRINSLTENVQTRMNTNTTAIATKAAVGSGTPSTQTLPDTAATGSSTEAARLDHVHTMPAATSEFIGCRITNASSQSTSSGGTHIVFAGTNSEATMFDTPGSGNDPFWDSSGDTSFINFPVTGKYWCNLSYVWGSSIGTATKADIYCTHYDSGTTRTVARVTEGSLQSGIERHGQITFMLNVRNAADYLRFVAVDNGNNSLSINSDNDSGTIFQCFKVD